MAGFIAPSDAQQLLVGGSAKFSVSSQFIIATSANKVTLYRSSSPVERVYTYDCLDKVDALEISPDERFFLCAMYSRNCVQIFSTSDVKWKCRVNEGPAGMISAAWCPDSQAIITESDFGIQLSLWSLVDSSQSVITFPKPMTKVHTALANFNKQPTSTIAFSDNGQFLAVVHRIELQDHIGIYSLHPLLEVTKFRSKTADIACIQWLPMDTHIVTIDVPLYYKCAIYSPSGEMLACVDAYQNALGIRTLGIFRPHPLEMRHALSASVVAPPSTSSLIAVGSFDGKIRCLAMYSWQVVLTLPLVHPRDLEIGLADADLVTKVELSRTEHRDLVEAASLDYLTATTSSSTTSSSSSNVTVSSAFTARMLKNLPKTTLDPRLAVAPGSLSKAGDAVALPVEGVHWLCWSGSTTYLAASDESYNRVIWIWQPLQAKLVDLIVSLEGVTCAAWRPQLPSTTTNTNHNVNANNISQLTATSRGVTGMDQSTLSTQPSLAAASSAAKNANTTGTDSDTNAEPVSSSVGSGVGQHDILAYCCGGQFVYLWSPTAFSTTSINTNNASTRGTGGHHIAQCMRRIEVVSTADLAKMKVRGVEWSADGTQLLCRGKDLFVTLDMRGYLPVA